MLNSFQSIIYREQDETCMDRHVWVRISADAWGFSVATFKEKPTTETAEEYALTVFHFDPCHEDKSKLFIWDEHHDSEQDDGQEILLVESIDGCKKIPE